MVALLLCYHFTVQWTSEGDISASAICYLWRFFLVHHYISIPSEASLATLVAFVQPSFLCSLCCNMLSANDSGAVDSRHEHTLLWPSIFL